METDDLDSKPNDKTPILSIIAIVMSFGALLVSVLEVSAIRDEQRIQVWPYVSVDANYSEAGYRLIAVNKGIGPARVRTLNVTYNGEPVGSLDQLIIDTVGEEDAFSYDLYQASDIGQSVMSPDESRILFGVPWEPRTRRLAEAWSGNISIAVCYCSVYDECWESRLNAGEPEPVKACSVD